MVEELNWGAIIVQALAFWFVYKLGQASMLKQLGEGLKDEIEKQGLQIERDEDGNISLKREETLMEIERIGTLYYAYAKDGQFLAQGPDFRELLESIKKQYPGRSFRLDKYQANLTEEETGRMIKSIFEVFGDKEKADDKTR